MTLDSSAIVAILCREPGFEDLLGKLNTARLIIVGAPTVAECQLVVTIKIGREGGMIVERFLNEANVVVVPFGRDHVSFFYEGFLRFGKGRHPARLNMGDCFTYATARVASMPVLFTGGDFALTDLTPA